MKYRALGLVFALLYLCSLGVNTASALANEDISPYYTMISSIHGACYIKDGTLDLSGTVTARVATTTAKVTLTLQAHIGGKWKSQGSWSATGTKSATRMKEVAAKPDVLYRLKITGYVSSNTGQNETATIYSEVVTY